jgi:hypothetical protein
MSGVESVSSARKPKRNSKAQKLNQKKLARLALWAVRIDANGDGKISRAELEARIASRQAEGKKHGFASAVLANLSTLDATPDDGEENVGLLDAANFLKKYAPGKTDQAVKKLDTTS